MCQRLERCRRCRNSGWNGIDRGDKDICDTSRRVGGRGGWSRLPSSQQRGVGGGRLPNCPDNKFGECLKIVLSVKYLSTKIFLCILCIGFKICVILQKEDNASCVFRCVSGVQALLSKFEDNDTLIWLSVSELSLYCHKEDEVI